MSETKEETIQISTLIETAKIAGTIVAAIVAVLLWVYNSFPTKDDLSGLNDKVTSSIAKREALETRVQKLEQYDVATREVLKKIEENQKKMDERMEKNFETVLSIIKSK